MKKKKVSEFILRILFSVIGTIIAFAPLWFYIFIKNILSPEGFWQNFFLLGLGFYFLGAIQIILLVILIAWVAAVWSA